MDARLANGGGYGVGLAAGPARPWSQRAALQVLAVGCVVAATTYAALLCFVNTQLFGITNALFMLTDGVVAIAALGLAMAQSHRKLRLVLALLLFHLLSVGVITGEFDLKTVRDPLVAFAFLYLGIGYGSAALGQRTVVLIGTIVILFGLWEYLAKDSFTQYFNVRNFFIARGLMDDSISDWFKEDLFVSSMRFQPRSLVPALGLHRVSSVFLEPVSMGNFGAIIAAWALVHPRFRSWGFVLAAGVAAFGIIMPDARFGSIVVLFFVLAVLVPLRFEPLITAALPLVVVTFLIFWGAFSGVGVGDDLPTRLAISGRAITSMSLDQVFGFSALPLSTLDSGYYYVLRNFGLHGSVLLWAAFCMLRAPSARAQRFKLFVAIYLALLMAISGGSMFAMKTAALMWFLMGCLCAVDARRARAGQGT